MKRFALLVGFLLPAATVFGAPRGGGFGGGGVGGGFAARSFGGGGGFSHAATSNLSGRAGTAPTNSASRFSSGSSHSSTTANSSTSSSSTGSSSTGNSSSGGMSGGCMGSGSGSTGSIGSTSTGSTSTGTTSTGSTSTASVLRRAAALSSLSSGVSLSVGGSSTAGYGAFGNLGSGFGGANAVNTNAYAVGVAPYRQFNSTAQATQSNSQSAGSVATTVTNAASDTAALNLPARNWAIDGGTYSVDGQYVGVLQGSVIVRKDNGTLTLLPVDRLTASDRQYVSSVAGEKALAVSSVATDSQ
jgi:hypothetical protein